MADDFISIEDLQQQIILRRKSNEIRNLRMDFWHSIYLLIDENQLTKSKGLIRFVSNEPRTALDLAHAVMSRHPFRARIPMTHEDKEERREGIDLLERGIEGAFHDVDRRMNKRGLPTARGIAAWHLLLRGWAANRLVIRDQTHPLDFEPWDMRFTYPEFDRYGLASVIYESVTSWGDIIRNFPDAAEEYLAEGSSLYKIDLDMMVSQYEFWDRNQHAIAVGRPRKREIHPRSPKEGDLVWAEEPYLHEIKDEEGEPTIPATIVPSHGLPIQHTPPASAHRGGIWGPADLAIATVELPRWKRSGGWVADQGRSLLASVEDSVGGLNEIVSTVWQIMDNDAFGTWVANTRTGEEFEVGLGNNTVNYLRTGESISRVAGMAASPDVYNLLAYMSEEMQKGTLDQKLVRGLMEFRGSGFLRAQMENAALNSLGPWVQAYEFWASENAQSIMNQLHQGSGKQFTVWAEGSDRRLFKMEFGPDMVEEVVLVEMKAKPALPDDLAVRVNIAAQLANPARPLASIQTIFDRVLEWPDAQKEKDLLFDDIADLDPIVVMLRLQNRMIARGLPEVAELFGDKAFMMAFVQQAMQARMLQQGGGAGRPETSSPARLPPTAAPPEQQGIEPGREGVAPTPEGGAEGAQ